MSSDNQSFATRLKDWREAHRLTQAGLAQATGCRRATIHDLETGRAGYSASSPSRIKVEQFMSEATEETIASFRGPGVGNSLSGKRRGEKLRRNELDRVEVNRLSPVEIDDELGGW